MFNRLFDLSYQRTGLQALGMYLAYGVLNVLVAFVAGMVLSLLNPAATFDDGVRVGTLVVVISCVIVGGLMVHKKGMVNFKGIALVILAGLLAGFGGTLLGMIPVAYLSTQPGKTVSRIQ
jgi:hypothetical protein